MLTEHAIMNWLKETERGVILNIRVVPRAARDGLAGLWQDAVKIRLQAPPVEGKANRALVRFLSRLLDVPPSSLQVVSGKNARQKRLFVTGMTAGQAIARWEPTLRS